MSNKGIIRKLDKAFITASIVSSIGSIVTSCVVNPPVAHEVIHIMITNIHENTFVRRILHPPIIYEDITII